MLFYTDGIIEAQNAEGEYFGLGRFTDFIIMHEGDGRTRRADCRTMPRTFFGRMAHRALPAHPVVRRCRQRRASAAPGSGGGGAAGWRLGSGRFAYAPDKATTCQIQFWTAAAASSSGPSLGSHWFTCGYLPPSSRG
ncbi:hypothetical protein ACFSTC_37800 [Nonomuraea ferruginea]